MSNSPECNTDRISDAVDGLLDEAGMEAMQQHLQECSSCSRAYEEQLRISSMLQSLPTLAAPHDLMEEVREAIRQQATVRKGTTPFFQFTWRDVLSLYPWRTASLAGAMCLAVILFLWIPSQSPAPNPILYALELRSDEEVAGLDIELAFTPEITEACQPVVPSGLGDFLVASHRQGATMRISMASAQTIHPCGQTHILELPLSHEHDPACGADAIRILSVRAYRGDGKPAQVEIKATPMQSTLDSKLNTTA